MNAFATRQLANALVQPVILFGAARRGKWRKETTIKKKTCSNSKCLRRIYKLHWPYVISNDKLLKRGQTHRDGVKWCDMRWSWIGHVLRMDHSSHCATALTRTPEGTRKVGRPKTTWRRTVEKEREQLGWTSYGAKPEHNATTEAIGIIVSRPYAPAGVNKKEGESEVGQRGWLLFVPRLER